MYQTIKQSAIAFHRSFRSSAVILIGRLNVLIGAAWTVAISTDPHMLANIHPIFNDPRVATAWIMLNGLLTEYGRRRPGTLAPLDPVEPYQPSSGPLK